MLMTYILYFVVAIESMIASHICRMHSRKKQHDALVQLTHDPTMPRGAGIATHNSTGSLNALGASAHWRPSAPGGDAMAVAAARAVADVDGSAPPEGKGGQQLVVMGLPPPSVAAARDSAHSMRRGLGGGGGASALVVVPPQQLQLVDAGGSDTAVVVPGGGVVLTPAVRGAATGATTSQSPLLPPAAQAAAAASAGSLGSSELDVTLDVLPSPGGGARGSALPRSGPITAGQQHPQQQQREMGRSVSGARRHNVPEGAVEASALLTTAAPGGGAGPLAEALESCFKSERLKEPSRGAAARLPPAHPRSKSVVPVRFCRDLSAGSAGAKEAPDSPTASAVKPLNVSAEKQQRAASGSGAALGEPSPVGGAAAGGVNTPFAGAGGSTHRWTGFMGMGVRRNVSQLGRCAARDRRSRVFVRAVVGIRSTLDASLAGPEADHWLHQVPCRAKRACTLGLASLCAPRRGQSPATGRVGRMLGLGPCGPGPAAIVARRSALAARPRLRRLVRRAADTGVRAPMRAGP